MQHQLEHNLTGALVIVDDKAELVHSTVELLRREYLAVPVIGYSDSREAAALVARARPAVLICNHQMPPVGGVDLITMAQKRWGQLSTIALVSGAGLGPGGHVRASAHLICLEKPFSIRTLCECIVELAGPRPRALPEEWVAAPLSKPAAEPTAESAAEPTAESTAEPTAESTVEPAGESTAEPAAESAAEPAAEPAAESAAESVTAAVAEDFLLSSDTPLPLPARRAFGRVGDGWGSAEALELLDEEIEIIGPSLGHLGPDQESNKEKEVVDMALTTNNVKENLAKLETIEGFIGAALADSDSGMCLGYLGGGGVMNLEIAAASNTEVVRSKRKAIKALNLRDEIEDILITLGKQYHLIRPVRTRANLFFYLVLDRQRANLAMARFNLADAERDLPM